MKDIQIEEWFHLTYRMVVKATRDDLSKQKRILELRAMAKECTKRPKLKWIPVCIAKAGLMPKVEEVLEMNIT